ncbi:CRISPR-associated protein Cas5 [Ralstonia solanacearum]|nr:CRISPR-associated protein Cas5 [Ralstonia solanacearum]
MKAIFKEWHSAPPLAIAQTALELHQAADQIAANRTTLCAAGQVLPRVVKQWKAKEQDVRDFAAGFYDAFLTAVLRRFGFQLAKSVPPLDTTEQTAYAVAWVRALESATPPPANSQP